eukprot:TRINITY_DN46509_c0_g1_i1.p2 TRINITY_DN46509_c0_g1~~TRINITY_DN46509_c0_g1_i1.p2  ORF type:complete len:284 (+),score=76.74 TRINITY_DN46509_c0_g1_i1:63-854(+)
MRPAAACGALAFISAAPSVRGRACDGLAAGELNELAQENTDCIAAAATPAAITTCLCTYMAHAVRACVNCDSATCLGLRRREGQWRERCAESSGSSGVDSATHCPADDLLPAPRDGDDCADVSERLSGASTEAARCAAAAQGSPAEAACWCAQLDQAAAACAACGAQPACAGVAERAAAQRRQGRCGAEAPPPALRQLAAESADCAAAGAEDPAAADRCLCSFLEAAVRACEGSGAGRCAALRRHAADWGDHCAATPGRHPGG